MQEFEFPTNIKQVGSISGKIKIYVEDYVCTYLQQYAESQGYKESLAVLLGRQMVIDGQKILFISGAVQAKYLKEQDGIETFTEESWKYVDGQSAEYFADLEILGCMQSQPGYGVYLNVNYGKYFREIFSKTYHVFFILDPIERTNAFFTFDKEKRELTEAKGYFVYYDRNESMHEYMLNNKVVGDKFGAMEEGDEEEEIKILSTKNTDREIREKANPVRVPKKSGVQRRLVNMLVSVSAVLLVICFVMGVGLMQNEDRIARLERDLENINISYAAIMETINNGRTEAVFAAQPDEGEEIGEVLPAENSAPLISENGSNLLQEAVPETPQPAAEPSATAETAASLPAEIPQTYTVEDGDNLLYISLRFYGTTDMVERIMEYNGLSDPDKIFFGKIIKLPPSE